jgi:Flp pilus assembly protein TadG
MLIRFFRDRRGVTAIVTALGFVAAAGAAGIAIDVASWLAAQRSLQNASDQAAYSAVVGVTAGQSGYTNALGVLAQSGYGCSSAGSQNPNGHLACTGPNGVSVAVNSPPTQGSYTGDNTAWEVIVSKPQKSYFTRFFLASAPTVSGRAVGLKGGNVCILALDTRSSDIHSIFGGTNANVNIGGTCQVADNLLNSSDTDDVDVKSGATLTFNSLYMRDATKCDSGSCDGTLTVTKPIQYNQAAIADPYSGRTIPAATGTCDQTNLVITTSQTLNPGTYCGTNNHASLSVGTSTLSRATTTNPGASGTNTLTFATLTGITAGMGVSDLTNTSAIPAGTTVQVVNPSLVVISTTVFGGPGGLKSGDIIQFTASTPTTVTLSSGVYILDGQGSGTAANSCSGSDKPTTCVSGNLQISNGATVTGSGVTIVLTTSTSTAINIGNAYIDSSSALSISAPSSNVNSYPVQGIALWQDPRAPYPNSSDGNKYTSTTQGVNTISSGAATSITGLIYFPSEGLFYSGGSGGSACTQVVAFSIVFKNSSQFTYPSNCASAGGGELPIGGTPKLAE